MSRNLVLLIGCAAPHAHALRSISLRPRVFAEGRDEVLKLRGGAATEQTKTGKMWVASSFTRDHVRLAWELPGYLGSYLNPLSAIEPSVVESVMVTVNSINACPYCTGLHGQLLRTTGLEKPMSSPAVDFAKVFAEEAGRGESVRTAFTTLVAAEGSARAKNIRALCWMLLWGKTTGNSINAVRDKLVRLKLWKLSPFDVLMFAYYGPLFLVIGILNASLKFFPTVPAWFSAFFGAFLWLPQMLHILPMGILCLALRILFAPFGGLNL